MQILGFSATDSEHFRGIVERLQATDFEIVRTPVGHFMVGKANEVFVTLSFLDPTDAPAVVLLKINPGLRR